MHNGPIGISELDTTVATLPMVDAENMPFPKPCPMKFTVPMRLKTIDVDPEKPLLVIRDFI